MFKIRKLIYIAFIRALLAGGCKAQTTGIPVLEESGPEATGTDTLPPATATPEPPAPTPEPMKVDPPVGGEYQAHISTLAKTCDPAAQLFVPSFTAASLSLTPENKLVIDAASTTYELALSTQTYHDDTGPSDGWDFCQGIFTLQQPVEGEFALTMTLYHMPGSQWNGIWLVLNEETGESCGGLIDLLPPELDRMAGDQ